MTNDALNKEKLSRNVNEWLRVVRGEIGSGITNKLPKLARNTIIRMCEDGTLSTTENCAMMKPPSKFAVRFMDTIRSLDVGAHDIDNGNMLLTNVTLDKLGYILSERHTAYSGHFFNYVNSDCLNSLGLLSYYSLPFEELLEYDDLMSSNRSRIKLSSDKKMVKLNKLYKITVSANDNFEHPDNISGDDYSHIETITSTFQKAVRRVKSELEHVYVGNSMDLPNTKFDMYCDEIPNGLINYFKLIGLDYFKVYLRKGGYDMSKADDVRSYMNDVKVIAKYNKG